MYYIKENKNLYYWTKDMEEIIVLDFKSEYNKYIMEKLEELNIKAKLVDFNIKLEEIKKLNIKGIILSGSPKSVYSLDSYKCDERIFKSGIPILGICYGMQLISEMMGGKVEFMGDNEYGQKDITIFNDDTVLFKNLSLKETVWMDHSDHVVKVPDGFTITSKSERCFITSIENKNMNIYGVQFHPEMHGSVNGLKMFKNFIEVVRRVS